MFRPAIESVLVIAAIAVWAVAGSSADQAGAAGDAVAAMQRGDFQSAEKTLRAEVAAHANDPWPMSLLGVALDNEKKLSEAEEFHRRAVALAPGSADVLNNYGTHLWYAGQYGPAETIFTKALSAAPAYFKVLYNLGVMATFTGHYDRARDVLEAALRQQPQSVDVLYRLACVDEAARQWDSALVRLAQAGKLDPRRADVQKLLAVTTAEVGALDDSAAAWDRYLQLAPDDEPARRERGYTAAKMGKIEEAVADLKRYVERHPDDPVGQYELGQTQHAVDMTEALAHFDKALALDPNFLAARSARGNLYSQEGKPEAAVKDLEIVASKQPDDPEILDRLGQTYQALDRTADAVPVLRKAAELNPEDSKILLHYGRALADAGRTDESKAVMERFRQLGPEKKKGVPAGLVEYLSLSPEQRRVEYRGRVEKAVREHPEDPAAQVSYLKLALEDGNADHAAAAAKQIAALKPGAAILADAGHALLATSHYALAKDLLAQTGEAHLDLAVATFHASGAKAGLDALDRVAESERAGEYYLARAQMLDAAGKSLDAFVAIDQALATAAGRPELYLQATGFLVKKGKAPEALRAITSAASVLPENRDVLLMRATTLEFARQSDEAERLLIEIQNRWPEWSAVWLAHGIILNTHRRYEEARKMLETAVALGDSWIQALAGRILSAPPGTSRIEDPPYLARLFDGSLWSR